MRILIIGNGGREHALTWKLAQSPHVSALYVAPGNAGTTQVAKTRNLALRADDVAGLAEFAQTQGIDLTVVGPEAPLALGLVDRFQALGLACFGPTQSAARLETSKAFSKDFFIRHQIPTARYAHFEALEPALAYLARQTLPVVIKADGLAAGKGVIIASTHAEAEAAVRGMLTQAQFGAAGNRVVIEEYLEGEEASFIVITDGIQALPFPAAQDHKRVGDADTGPNTGGMGAYAPAPVLTTDLQARVMAEVILPTLRGMAAEGCPYQGFLYAGLMLGPDGRINVLEYNCRLGDPEAEILLFGLDSDLLPLLQAALQGSLDAQTLHWTPGAVLGVVLAAEGYPGQVSTGDVISGLDADWPDTEVFHAGTRLAGAEVHTQGGRVLCVCARGVDLAQAQQRAYQRVSQLHWRGLHYRSDIGWRALR